MMNLGTIVLVVLANDYGYGADVPLRYAEADAARFVEALSELGRVDRVHAAIGGDSESAQAALAEAQKDLRDGRALGEKTLLIFYYSGHADGDYLRAGDSRMTWAQVRHLVDGAGADLTLSIIDACDSGSAIAQKGGSYAPPFAEIEVERLSRGSMWISSSRSDEASYESDELGGSFFSHFLVSGLRGAADVDEDGRITLNEAYQFTFDRTVGETSLKLKKTQHPTYRSDLAGEGEIILSEPRRSSTMIVLPRETSGRWYLARRFGARRTVLEVPKSPGQLVRMSVPAGAYVVYRKEADHILLTEISVPENQEVVVDPKKLEAHAYVEVLAKGGGIDLSQHIARLSLQIASPVIDGAEPAPALALSFTRRGRMFGFGGTVSVSRYKFSAVRTLIHNYSVEPQLFGEIFFDSGLGTVAFSAGPTAMFLAQSSNLVSAFSIAPGFGAAVLGERKLFGDFSVSVELGARAHLLDTERGREGSLSAYAGAGISFDLN